MSRNYKKEYREYQGKPAQREYRSGLNKENRRRGTYGNGDGLDVSHHHTKGRGGGVVGLEAQGKTRARKVKAVRKRLKK